MSKHLSFTAAIACIVLLLFDTSAVGAQSAVQVELIAPAGCPQTAELEAAIAARGARLDQAGSVQALRAQIDTGGDGFDGRLWVISAGDADPAVRQVQGASCREVVDALAVVAAITLSQSQPESVPEAPPASREAPPTTDPAPARDAPSAVPPPGATAAPAAGEGGAKADGGAAKGGPAPPPGGLLLGPFEQHRKLQVEAGEVSLERTYDMTLLGGAALGVLPGQAVPRLDFINLSTTLLSTPGAAARTFIAAPLLLGRVSMLGPATFTGPAGAADLFAMSTGVGGCLSPYLDRAGVTWLLCGEFGFGVATTQVQDASGNALASTTRAFGSIGASTLFQIALGSRVHLSLRIGMDSMTQAFSATGADGRKIFQSARFLSADGFDGYGISGYVQLGLGVHF